MCADVMWWTMQLQGPSRKDSFRRSDHMLTSVEPKAGREEEERKAEEEQEKEVKEIQGGEQGGGVCRRSLSADGRMNTLASCF